MEILKVNNLGKTYGQGHYRITALSHVSFSMDKGEMLAVTGPSGSGKSTLLHLIGGVDAPTSGTVLIDGHDIHAYNRTEMAIFRRRQIGLVYQFHNLIPTLDVEQNIVLPMVLDNRQADQGFMEELITVLRLDKVRHRLPQMLSGGEQQRVAIGRALIGAPAIVLADEPTGSLDRRNGQEIMELLKETSRRYRQTMILVTHDEAIASQTDRKIEIIDGTIASDMTCR